MKRLIFVLLSALVFVLVSCSTPVNTDDKEEQTVTPVSENEKKGGKKGGSGSNGGESNGNTEEPEEVINWVEVVADEESTSGFAYFFIDQRVANPVADLVAEKKIKLVLVSTKSKKPAQRYSKYNLGLAGNESERINVYKVYVNSDIVNEVYLEDENLNYSDGTSNNPFRFHIVKNENIWKMDITMTISSVKNANPIRYLNTYYE